MTRRFTNLLLLVLVAALAVSGLLGWVVPETAARVWYDAHRALGGLLVVLLGWKYGIARASLRRRLPHARTNRSFVAGLAAALALLGSIGFGLAWTLQLVSFDALWGYSPLNLHVQLGLVLLPLLGWHALRRRERRLALHDLAGRRNALRLIGLGAALGLSWRAVGWAAESLAPVGQRRASGSKHAGSFSGNTFPMTIWLFDRVPPIDIESWRLSIVGNLAMTGERSYAELLTLPEARTTAVLDCTGGWWSEQVWSGVSLGDLLDRHGVAETARTADVVSVTGHRWTFPLSDLRGAILATRVGDEPLSPGHGYPLRLVAPERRGFQWVKWVDRIEVA